MNRSHVYNVVTTGCMIAAVIGVIGMERALISRGVGLGLMLGLGAISGALYIQNRERSRQSMRIQQPSSSAPVEALEAVIRGYEEELAHAHRAMRQQLASYERALESESLAELVRKYDRVGAVSRPSVSSTHSGYRAESTGKRSTEDDECLAVG